jgi:hypothetical protein
MRVGTGIHHNEAITLYQSLGFHRRGPYYDCPTDVAAFFRFMETELPPPPEVAVSHEGGQQTSGI